jgi:hypothetical protein
MTLLPAPRIHGRIIPFLAVLAAGLVLALPGLAHADATSPGAAPAKTSTAGTAGAPANPVSAATATGDPGLTLQDTSATDTTSSATPGDASSGGLLAQPDAASWR